MIIYKKYLLKLSYKPLSYQYTYLIFSRQFSKFILPEINEIIKEKTLYVIPTPIGNSYEISLRALHILSKVNLIAAEDTRTSSKFLLKYGINNSYISYNNKNMKERTKLLINKLLHNNSIGLITDAGTPCVSDPGYHLVKECYNNNINVVGLSGSCACVTALSISGLKSDNFTFVGFFDRNEEKRNDMIRRLLQLGNTFIFYESPLRIRNTMKALKEISLSFSEFLNVKYFISRELTKLHETCYKGEIIDLNVDELAEEGEYTIVINCENKENIDNLKLYIVNNVLKGLKMNGVDKKKRIKYCSEEYNIMKRIVNELDNN